MRKLYTVHKGWKDARGTEFFPGESVMLSEGEAAIPVANGWCALPGQSPNTVEIAPVVVHPHGSSSEASSEA